MRQALNLARQGLGFVEPNPMVGCLLVRDGAVIGQGYHESYGGPHAEVNALESCRRANHDPNGATAYVTLEPCCHFGKTPPCTRALIEAGVARVVVAMADPFSEVNGGGLAELNAAGIETATGILEDQARELNAAYLKRVTAKKPWCIAKWAMTVDGRIATTLGQSQWITGETSRADVHRLRARCDAIVVGMQTVIADDPLLTARLATNNTKAQRTATRIVFCTQRLPPIESKLVQSAKQIPLLLIVSMAIENARLEQLETLGATVYRCHSSDRLQMVSEAMEYLGSLGMTNVMLEGGGELISSFVNSGEVDEYHVYIGAKVFGGRTAPGPIGGTGFPTLDEAAAVQLISLDRMDQDVKLVYRKSRQEAPTDKRSQ
ncbi:Riboflavin biosynthesis protein RibD [Novipirellula aureliae]|uniref:Riboflavin biosynthesis protein RibD n=2 Tax=Novipirellula aureliae TaxID=2527966 RepID=A0A5C6DBP8_9BACT|nr:Riboflavin biosynthesis protein RibD [Novipirellula aureliae]